MQTTTILIIDLIKYLGKSLRFVTRSICSKNCIQNKINKTRGDQASSSAQADAQTVRGETPVWPTQAVAAASDNENALLAVMAAGGRLLAVVRPIAIDGVVGDGGEVAPTEPEASL